MIFIGMHISISESASNMSAYAPKMGGSVSMLGAVLDSPCSVTTSSEVQNIDSGILPIGKLLRNGYIVLPFFIRLLNCKLSPNSTNKNEISRVQIFYEGAEERDGYISVYGQERGLSILIADSRGHIVRNGTALPSTNVNKRNMRIKYFLELIGGNKKKHLGFFHYTIRFKLVYY